MRSSQRIARVASACGIVIVGLNCQPSPPKINVVALEKEVQAIVPSSEMTKAEATKVFQLYTKIDGVQATGFNEVKDEGEFWATDPILAFKFKDSGNPIMRIQKSTGAITWHDGPGFPNLDALVSASRNQMRAPGSR